MEVAVANMGLLEVEQIYVPPCVVPLQFNKRAGSEHLDPTDTLIDYYSTQRYSTGFGFYKNAVERGWMDAKEGDGDP